MVIQTKFKIQIPTGIIGYTTGKWNDFPVPHLVMLVDKDYYMNNPEWFEDKAKEVGNSGMLPIWVEIAIIEVEKTRLTDLIPLFSNLKEMEKLYVN